MAEMYGPVAGYKIALTTPVMQQMVGFHAPVAGAILATTIHQAPITLRCVDYLRLGIECEIAVQFGADLPATAAPYSRGQVADALAAVMAAFELVDDREADYSTLATRVLTLIADNAWNAGIVLGPPVRDWRAVDLAAARGVLVIKGSRWRGARPRCHGSSARRLGVAGQHAGNARQEPGARHDRHDREHRHHEVREPG
jgi:2-keto-4-pentenoate hydratase